MNMESDSELDSLFAKARAYRVNTSKAEYGFETRLMAHLRAENAKESIWAVVSWRTIPFFATAVIVLALWHAQVISTSNEAQEIAYASNPESTDLVDTFN